MLNLETRLIASLPLRAHEDARVSTVILQGLRTKFFWTIVVKNSDFLSFGKQRIRNVHSTG